MKLGWRASAAMGAMRGLNRIGLAPTPARILRQPVETRMGTKVPRLLKGRVPKVRREDRSLPLRDGGSVGVRLYFPPAGAEPSPAVVYFHGGGWVTGGLPSCDHHCARMAMAGALVMSVAYRLAPENPYPAALTDCLEATDWLYQHAQALGGDPARLVIGGDSAGGNLAAATVIASRDLADPWPIAAQVLVYPALDHTGSTPGRPDFAGTGMSLEDLATGSSCYLGGHDPRDPLVSPLLVEDCAGLPPTLLITAAFDPLFPEGEAFASRLKAAGVPVHYVHYEHYAHGFYSVPMLYPKMREAWDELCTYVQSVEPAQ